MLALLLGVVACTVQITGRLVNGTQGTILIESFDHRGEQRESVTLPPGGKMDIPNVELRKLSIETNGNRLRYDISPIDLAFVYESGWGSFANRIVDMRIEDDGKIYLIRPESDSKVAMSTPQPSGYPLTGVHAENR